MGWFTVDHIAARVRRMGTLSVALVRNGGKKGGVSMRVRLSRDVQQAGGLTAGDTLNVQWGDGELAGRLLLTRAEGTAGTAQLRWQHPRTKAAVETRFGGLPDGHFPGVDGRPTSLSLVPRPAAPCPWKVEGAAIEVPLPAAWFSTPPDGARPVSRLEQAAAEPSKPTAPRMAFSTPAAKAASPRPVEEDKVERAIAMLQDPNLTEGEIIYRLRCTPAFLDEPKAELSRRRAAARAEAGHADGAAA